MTVIVWDVVDLMVQEFGNGLIIGAGLQELWTWSLKIKFKKKTLIYINELLKEVMMDNLCISLKNPPNPPKELNLARKVFQEVPCPSQKFT